MTSVIQIHNQKVMQPKHVNLDEQARLDEFDKLSVKLIHEANEIFGQKAEGLAEALKNVLGKEWSQRVVLKLLSNSTSEHDIIRFTINPQTFHQPIGLIKAIRGGTHIGLVESKAAYETLKAEVLRYLETSPFAPYSGAPYIELQVFPQDYHRILNELKSVGVIIL